MALRDEFVAAEQETAVEVSEQEIQVDLTGLADPCGNGEAVRADAEAASGASGSPSRIISRVLSPAVRLWVRSQLDHVEDLHIDIEAGDRQLLSGTINRVTAAASKAIYRGLHFSQIQVSSDPIQTNLRQVLRGKPFRLLAAFPVRGRVMLSAEDLTASLQTPLLSTAVMDFLLAFLPTALQDAETPPTLKDVSVDLQADQLTLTGTLVSSTGEQAIAIRSGLAIKNGNLLELKGFQQCQSVVDLVPVADSKSKFTIPLGSDVQLEQLQIQPDALICQGQILVRP